MRQGKIATKGKKNKQKHLEPQTTMNKLKFFFISVWFHFHCVLLSFFTPTHKPTPALRSTVLKVRWFKRSMFLRILEILSWAFCSTSAFVVNNSRKREREDRLFFTTQNENCWCFLKDIKEKQRNRNQNWWWWHTDPKGRK